MLGTDGKKNFANLEEILYAQLLNVHPGEGKNDEGGVGLGWGLGLGLGLSWVMRGFQL